MKNVRNGFAQTRNEMGRFGNRSKEEFTKFAVGAAMMGASLGGLMAMKPAIEASKEFGKAIGEASTLVDESTFATKDLRNITLSMAQTYGKMPADEAKALYQAISAGATDAGTATDFMTAANKFAIGGVTDVHTAMDGLTNAVAAYKAQGLTATDATDTMFIAIRQGKLTARELSEYLGHVAPLAANAGVSFSDLNAALASITVKGINARIATTGLKASLENIMKVTPEATAEAKRLGVEFNVGALRQKGFATFMKDITTSAKYNKDSLQKLFPSIEALNTMMALTSNNSSDFNANLEAMTHRQGATETAFNKMSNTLAFSQDKFEAMIQVAKIFVGDILAPMAQKTLKTMSKMVGAFNTMNPALRALLVHGFAAATALLGIGGALRSLFSAVKIVGAAIETFGIASAGSLVSALLPVAAAIGAIVVAYYGMKIALESSSLGAKFTSMWNQVKLGFEALQQLFSQGGFSGNVRKEFLKGENPILNFAIKVYLVVNRIRNFLAGLADGFEAAIQRGKPVFDALGKALDRIGDAFGTFSNDAAKSGKAFDAWGDAGASVGDRIGTVFDGLVAIFTFLLNVVASAMELWNKLSDSLTGASDATDNLSAAFDTLEASLGLNMGSTGAASAVWNYFAQTLSGAVSAALFAVSDAISVISSVVRDVAEVFAGAIDIVAGLAENDWTRVWKGMKETVVGVCAAIVDTVFGMIEGVASALDGLAKNAGKDLGLSAGLKKQRNAIKDLLTDAAGVDSLTKENQRSPDGVAADVAERHRAHREGLFPGPAVAAQASGAGQVQALAAAVAAQARGLPGGGGKAPAYTFHMVVDGATLGTIIAKANEAKEAQSFNPLNLF